MMKTPTGQWIEVSMSVDGESGEAVAELLSRYGYQGVALEQEGIMPEMYDDGAVPPPERLTIRAYIHVDGHTEETQARLESALGYMNMMYPMPKPTYRVVEEADWAEAWKAHYHPVRIGKRLFIRPRWIEVAMQPDDVELALDPGMAFGTGTHPTTQLCLEALEDLTQPGAQVLDMGTGSGILAIAAVKLGAVHALALDNDPVAVEVAQENSTLNGTADKITVGEGSLESIIASARRFDLIVVNIIARVIMLMCEGGLGQTVRPGGLAIFSGITTEQVEDVEAALVKTGLMPYKRRQQGDWMCIEARRAAE
ncbi:MAG: 50S ribosomal protein L11 methyltransferase [Chloroflexota bacterium]|nr:50S ribosomal protein L11 methyltransferase [Chloroflexota bacterium]